VIQRGAEREREGGRGRSIDVSGELGFSLSDWFRWSVEGNKLDFLLTV